MELGAFSISLAVKDIAVSKAFYEKLGFVETGGSADEGWLILVNQPAVIGLFQGMFEGNIRASCWAPISPRNSPTYDRSSQRSRQQGSKSVRGSATIIPRARRTSL